MFCSRIAPFGGSKQVVREARMLRWLIGTVDYVGTLVAAALRHLGDHGHSSWPNLVAGDYSAMHPQFKSSAYSAVLAQALSSGPTAPDTPIAPMSLLPSRMGKPPFPGTETRPRLQAKGQFSG